MGWTETHRRWQALQEIETLANAGATELPWTDDYAEIPVGPTSTPSANPDKAGKTKKSEGNAAVSGSPSSTASPSAG